MPRLAALRSLRRRGLRGGLRRDAFGRRGRELRAEPCGALRGPGGGHARDKRSATVVGEGMSWLSGTRADRVVASRAIRRSSSDVAELGSATELPKNGNSDNALMILTSLSCWSPQVSGTPRRRSLRRRQLFPLLLVKRSGV